MRRMLRLAEGRVLVEQMRLMCGHVGSSVIPSTLLLLVLFVVLSRDSGPVLIGAWCLLTLASKIYSWRDALRRLSAPSDQEAAPREVLRLAIIHAVDGALWGALCWIALDHSDPGSQLLMAAALTGVAANSMSILSPVIPVYIAFVVAELLVVTTKLFLTGGSSNTALGIGGVLYCFTMVGQAFNSARTARMSIDLRFENIELLARLREEKRLAESARRGAEAANQAKSRFLAAASHDLRQPVHAQGLFLEVLSQTPLTPHQTSVLASARRASLASSDMLNTLLDFSRIEAGVVKPHMQPFALQPLLHNIENDLAPIADARGLLYRSRDTSATLDSDASLVEMVLRNLVSNAIRYTENGGVLIACRQRASRGLAVIEVWDTGIGIAPENHGDIFREFHQLGNPERDGRKGLGLGLAIAKGLTRTLGGRIAVSSRPGRGTVFRLTLPLSRTRVATPAPAAQPGVGLLRGLHVLVIDDDEGVLSGMAHLLQRWDCDVSTAATVDEAMQLAARKKPDVVISDYRLPGNQTGREAIDSLRAMVAPDLPAIMVTGDTAPERLREALASGVPLLHKPVAPGELYRAVSQVVGRQG